mgnify:CR=1 FL=1
MIQAMSWAEFSSLFGQMVGGLWVTLAVFGLTLLFSLPLGLLIALGRLIKNKILRFPFTVYVLVLRGTPLLLQIIVIYFGPYYLFGLNYDRFVGVIIAFALNYAAYFAEIYRGGILSIPSGQYEAGKVLGFTRSKIFFKIVLPQVVKRILPPVSNEVITLVKDTSLVQIIGVVELFRVAQTSSSTSGVITPLFIAGAFYLVMNFVVTQVFSLLEKKLNYYK